MAKEQWRDVLGYEGYYQISNTGELHNVRFNRRLKKYPRPSGFIVCLSRNGGKKFKSLARLVFEAFKRPLEDNERVYHLNGDGNDNHIDNLYASPSLSKETLKAVCQDMTIKEMAEYFDKTIPAIWTALDHFNLAHKRVHNWSEKVDELRELYKHHTSLEIAEMYDTSHSNMLNILHYYGLYKSELLEDDD